MTKDKPNLVGPKLRYCRTNCGLSQQQVATALGINRTTYTYYESGRSQPPLKTLLRLSNIFRVDISALLPQEDNDTLSDTEPDSINPIYSLTKDEQNLLIYYRLLSNKDKADILAKITNISKSDN